MLVFDKRLDRIIGCPFKSIAKIDGFTEGLLEAGLVRLNRTITPDFHEFPLSAPHTVNRRKPGTWDQVAVIFSTMPSGSVSTIRCPSGVPLPVKPPISNTVPLGRSKLHFNMTVIVLMDAGKKQDCRTLASFHSGNIIKRGAAPPSTPIALAVLLSTSTAFIVT